MIGAVVLSMFSCKPDREFEANFTSIFVMQQNKNINGVDVPYFAPYFTVSSNRVLASYNVYSYIYNEAEDRNDTTFYPLQWQSATNSGIYTYYSPINLERYPWTSDTTQIADGPYKLTVKNTDGQEETASIFMDQLALEPLLGDVKIKKVQYYPGQHVTITIAPVENAKIYGISLSPIDQPHYRVLMNGDTYIFDKEVQIGTNRLNQYDDGQKFILRAIASNQAGLIRESSQIVIEMGKEGAEYTADVK